MSDIEQSNKIIQINDGDSLLIKPEFDAFFTRCCTCGMLHKMKITRKKEGIWLKITISDDVELEEYEIDNNIIRG